MAVITVSRQYGSMGDEIALRVCKTLKEYRYFDKAMMAQVASEVGLSPNDIVDFSEDHYEVRSFLDRLLGRGRSIAQADARREALPADENGDVAHMDEASSIRMVEGIIQLAYRQGNFVIVGRGGQAILQDMPGVLHVRCEAPMHTRIRRIQDRQRISLRAAERAVGEWDRAAAAYLKRFYAIEWSDSMLYHLVLNTGKWDVEAASKIIERAVKSIRL